MSETLRRMRKIALPKDRFENLFNRLPERYKEDVIDYMEYLLQKVAKQAWDDIPEIHEPLTAEEKEQLESAKQEDEWISLEDLERELNL